MKVIPEGNFFIIVNNLVICNSEIVLVPSNKPYYAPKLLSQDFKLDIDFSKSMMENN